MAVHARCIPLELWRARTEVGHQVRSGGGKILTGGT
eukprot:CAMPEP_0202745748 /NCGR_PEP_ID=MMETSP1388-20130828/7615_1 /ASSEMBLY_ACC=CAM_ASM_000864 /TAXON_ID=37098 /ORGANISM="Isochrysis sp, Strain CCMP1244" /LENGTH=35 /DNA_ID= /DNA_START= /DNA_END= /DNA_ORIENTATION=